MNSKLERIARRMDDGALYVAFKEELRRSSACGKDGLGKATVVTSAARHEGKTHVAVSLAMQAATVGRQRTLVVDAAAQERGCASRLLSRGRKQSDSASVPADARCSTSRFPRIDLLTWGPRVVAPDANGNSEQESLAEVLDGLRAKYDLIVIDGVSMADGPGTPGLLRCADRVLFVVEYRRLTVGQIQSYLARIDTPPILGVVLNKRRYPIPRFIYNRL